MHPTRRKQHTIGRPQTRPTYRAPQYLQLMPQHQDLKLLRPIRTTKQNQQLEQTASDPVSEAQALKQQTSIRIGRRQPLEQPE